MAIINNQQIFQFGNHTDIGKVRSVNEDYLGYFDTLNGHIFVVCDGMGGHVGGATASQLAVESIRAFFGHATYEDVPEALRQAILYANEQILAYANQNPHLKGMGTTCVVVLLKGEKVYHAHVGDSRLYMLHNSQLVRLTKDHSIVQQMVDAGMISEQEAENHPRKNEITQALGTMPHVEVALSANSLHLSTGDVLLLCTDGLNGMIADNQIRQVLAEDSSPQHKALKLVELANEAGGYDNITVQLIQFTSSHTPTFAEDMASTKTNKRHTKIAGSASAAKRGLDPALITLCALFGVVIILLLMGSNQLSDNTISTSDLKLEQSVGTATDQEITDSEEETDEVDGEESSTENSAPATVTPTSAKKPEPARESPAKETAAKNTTQPVTTPVSGETFITHTVRSGETFSAVARRYNVTNKTLQSWNPDVKDANIKADATNLKVKVRATHKVGPGDILDVVSQKYGVSKELIMAANGKTADRTARGETLVIPFAEKK